MATLKSIKSNYDLLSMQERFGLYQKASLRRDESELGAIYAATPMKSWNVIDFYFLREEIYRIDTVNLLSRLSHYGTFRFFLRLSGEREDEKKSDEEFGAASLSAYLYAIETDAWQIVCDELGFEVNWFRSLAAEICFPAQEMETKDEFIRHFAFSKDEAEKFLNKTRKRFRQKGYCSIITLEEKIKFYRDFIESI